MIENLGDVAVQLRERTWCIYSENDYKETITGTGVVGQVNLDYQSKQRSLVHPITHMIYIELLPFPK